MKANEEANADAMAEAAKQNVRKKAHRVLHGVHGYNGRVVNSMLRTSTRPALNRPTEPARLCEHPHSR